MKNVIFATGALLAAAGLPSASMALATAADDEQAMCSYEVCDEHWVPVNNPRPGGGLSCEWVDVGPGCRMVEYPCP